MHKACEEEKDLLCNAYCVDDVHADVAYFFPNEWPEQELIASLQLSAELRASMGDCYQLDVLSVQQAPEAPPMSARYPRHAGRIPDSVFVAYLVRYRLRGARNGAV